MPRFKSLALAICTLGSIGGVYAADAGLVPMSDKELAATEGQALMSLSYISPKDSNSNSGINGNIGFYKLGLEAEIELNANIRNLQLGCGGANGAGNCDIDIKNLSLSGLNDGTVAGGESAGSPTYSNGRASTSAKLTNPFIEFAIKNPDSASQREIKGFRLSAEAIEGLLSAGVTNGSTPSATDGIQNLSGYMQIAGTTGQVYTKASTFGVGSSNCLPGASECQSIGGKIQTALGGRYFRSLPNDGGTNGITVPRLKVDFNLPAFTVNGKRQTQAIAQNVTANIPWLPIAAAGDCPSGYAASCAAANSQLSGVNFSNDKLRVLLTQDGDTSAWSADGLLCVFGACAVSNSNFAMAAGSAITDLKVNITFKQALSMIHNIPLTGTGGYLALQSQALRWPGANTDDIAQSGWWMSFAQPVQLGYLEAQNDVDISAVLPQVAKFATDALVAGDRINVSGVGDTLKALTNSTLSKKLQIDVGNSPAAQLTLENQQLKSQQLATNCYGNLKFC